MKIESIIEKLSTNQDLLQKYSVKNIRIFGSVTRGNADAGSDVDVLVEFDPTANIGLFEFSRLRYELSKLFGCDVDLVTPDALHKSIKEEILNEAVHAA
jgi:predicted nucleotidyltransferase